MIDLTHLRLNPHSKAPRAGRGSVAVRLTDLPPAAADPGGSTPAHRICNVCTSSIAGYTCPRCLMPYCGAKCYAQHDVRCSEAFFRAHVERVQRSGGFVSDSRSGGGGDSSVGPPGAAEGATQLEEEPYPTELSESRLESIATLLFNCDYDITLLPEDDRKFLLRHLRRRSLELCPVVQPWWAPAPAVTTPDLSATNDLTSLDNEGDDSPGDAAARVRVMISHNSSAFVDAMRVASAGIRATPSAQRLLNQESSSSAQKAWGFQIAGMLLGYVVTMRSLNESWSSGYAAVGAVREAFDLFFASTPAVHSASVFRPTSIADVLGAWTKADGGAAAPPVLRDMSARSIAAVLRDLLSILQSPNNVNYALIDIWCLACCCDEFLTRERAAQIGGGVVPTGAPLVSELRRFESCVFSKKKSSGKDFESVSRKAFFLLLRSVCDLESLRPFTWANALAEETRDYISTIEAF